MRQSTFVIFLLASSLTARAVDLVPANHAAPSTPVPHETTPETKPDPCSFEGITDHCRVFHGNKPGNDRISYPDGTFIPNFPVIIAGRPISAYADYREKIEQDRALQQKRFLMQRDLSHVLDRIPSALMHPDFKDYLRDPQKIIDLSDLVARIDEKKKEGEGEDDTPPPEALLWWPPERPLPEGAPEEKSVKTEEALEKLKKIFPTKADRKAFLKVADEAAELADLMAAKDSANDSRGRHGGHHRLSERPSKPDRPGLAANPTLIALTKVSDARFDHVKELFEFARGALIEQIAKGRKENVLSAAERAAMAKISSVVFVNNPDDPMVKSACIGSIPDAFYTQDDHSVSLCRNYYNYPDADLVSTFGHELFHSIDPCSAQFPTFEINKDALAKLTDPALNLPVRAVREDDERFVVYQKLKDALDRTGVTTPEIETFASTATADFFEQGDEHTQVLHQVAGGTPFNPDPTKSEYLFRNVFACLQKADRGGFRPESQEEIRQLAHDAAEDRLRAHARDPGYDPRRDEEAIFRAYQRFPECLDQKNRSQMCEVMADWAGAKVLGKFLEGKTLRTPEEKLTALAYFADMACLRRAQAHQRGRDNSATGVVSAAQATLDKIHDEHPDPVKRVDDILLREKSVVRAVCGTEPKVKSCEEDERP